MSDEFEIAVRRCFQASMSLESSLEGCACFSVPMTALPVDRESLIARLTLFFS